MSHSRNTHIFIPITVFGKEILDRFNKYLNQYLEHVKRESPIPSPIPSWITEAALEKYIEERTLNLVVQQIVVRTSSIIFVDPIFQRNGSILCIPKINSCIRLDEPFNDLYSELSVSQILEKIYY